MKRIAHCLLASLGCAATAQAEVAVYHDQQFKVPSLVVMNDDGPVYYSDLRFTTNEDGSYTLVRATRRNLALVDSATVTVDETIPAQAELAVSGIMSIPCAALEEPAVLRNGNTFRVILAESALDPDAVCMSLLAITEFDITLPLELSGLAAGEYRVIVNGRSTHFVLHYDAD